MQFCICTPPVQVAVSGGSVGHVSTVRIYLYIPRKSTSLTTGHSALHVHRCYCISAFLLLLNHIYIYGLKLYYTLYYMHAIILICNFYMHVYRFSSGVIIVHYCIFILIFILLY